jgi:hypothetical protein
MPKVAMPNPFFYPPKNVKKFILVQKENLAHFVMDIYYSKFIFQFGCNLCQSTNKDQGVIPKCQGEPICFTLEFLFLFF